MTEQVDLDALIAEARRPLTERDITQSAALTRDFIRRLADALESTVAELRRERERADENERRWYGAVNRANSIVDSKIELAEDLSRAEETIEKVREESEHAMHPEQLPTRCGVCRIERLLTEYDKQKEVEHD